MIIGLLLELMLGLFSVLTAGISIMQVPVEALQAGHTALEYMVFGLQFLNNYVDVPFLMTLFSVILGVDTGFMIYRFCMWVTKKVPMIGIE